MQRTEQPARARGWLPWLAAAVVGVAIAVAAPLFSLPAGPGTPGPDLLPLYLGAHALRHGVSPVDPAALADQVAAQAVVLPPGVAHLWSPYPSSASTVAIPLTAVPWSALRDPLWLLMAACLVGAGLAAGAGGSGRSGNLGGAGGSSGRAPAVIAAGLGVIAVCGLDVSAHALVLGQVNPLLVALLVVASVCMVRGYDVVAGVLIAVGAGVKYAPAVLLLPAVLLWRPRVLIAATLAGLAIVAATFAHFPGWTPAEDVARGLLQATRGQSPQGAPWGGLWAWRAVPFGAVTLAAIGALTGPIPRPGAMGAAVGMTLAFVAAVVGGLSPPHEMLFVAPALVFSAAWLAETGWRRLPAACAFLAAAAALSPLDQYPQLSPQSQGHAQPLIFLVYALGLVRVGAVLRGR